MNELLNNEILNNMEYCKEVMKLENDNPKKFEMVNTKNGFKIGRLEGYPIYFDPIYMRKQDQVMAMACLNGDIVIDEKLLRMSYEGKLVNLYHELGHIKLNHKAVYPDTEEYKIDRKEFSKSGRILPIELEADEYCYERLDHDTFMKGIYEIRAVASQCNRDINELDLRIQHFKNKIK